MVGLCVYRGPPGEWDVCPSAIVSVDHQMVGSGQYVCLMLAGTTGPPGEWAVCQPGTIWPPDGGAEHLEDHQVSGQYVSLVPQLTTRRWGAHLKDHQVSGQYVSLVPQLTTRRWGSPPKGPPGEWAVFQSSISWPPDGGAAHLQDHQVSGQYVSLVLVDHQMVGQPT